MDNFIIRVIRADEQKKFSLNYLLFSELVKQVEDRKWESALPTTVKFFYLDVQGNELISVDDDEDFRIAIQYCIEELDRKELHLILATSTKDAIKISRQREETNFAAVVTDQELAKSIDMSDSLASDISSSSLSEVS